MNNINATEIISIVISLISGGGISALIASIVASKKQSADNRHTDQETEGLRIQNEITEMDYINKRLQEISEISRKEAEVVRDKNDELQRVIEELNSKLASLMQWIVTDNLKYRTWLETELRKIAPELDFPETTEPPNVFGANPYHNTTTPTNQHPTAETNNSES